MYTALQLNPDGSTCAVRSSEPPAAPIEGQVLCTQEEFANYKQYTIVEGVVVRRGDGHLLSLEKDKRIAQLKFSYAQAITQPVAYTTKGGVAQTFQADTNSVDNLQRMILAMQSAGEVPKGFYWIAQDNTKVPFEFADLTGLAAAIGSQGFMMFAKLQQLKDRIVAAQNAAEIQAVVWG